MKKIMILLLGLLTFSLQAAPEPFETDPPGIQDATDVLVVHQDVEAPLATAEAPTALSGDYLITTQELASSAILEVGAVLPVPPYWYHATRRFYRRQLLRGHGKDNKSPPNPLFV